MSRQRAAENSGDWHDPCICWNLARPICSSIVGCCKQQRITPINAYVEALQDNHVIGPRAAAISGEPHHVLVESQQDQQVAGQRVCCNQWTLTYPCICWNLARQSCDETESKCNQWKVPSIMHLQNIARPTCCRTICSCIQWNITSIMSLLQHSNATMWQDIA